MQFLSNLFGDSGGALIGAVFALGIVLVLIVLCVWLLKFTVKASGAASRGRARRLTLVDSMQVDPKRQLLIIRRDDVEHLILTGGPQDVVIESGIAAEKPMPIPALAPRSAATRAGRPTQAREAEKTIPIPTPPAPRSAVERLRELARPLGRASTSLRHTGLMRPVSRMDVIPGYLDGASRDSAKTTPLVEARGGDGSISRDGFKADGH